MGPRSSRHLRREPVQRIHDVQLGIDIGTTASKVAYLIYERGSDTQDKRWKDIGYIRNWPDNGAKNFGGGSRIPPNCILYQDDQPPVCGYEAIRQLQVLFSWSSLEEYHFLQHVKPFDGPSGKAAWRKPLPDKFEKLIEAGFITKEWDVLVDTLQYILGHTRTELQKLEDGLTEASAVRFNVSFPIMWGKLSGIRLRMKGALAQAAEKAGLGETTTVPRPGEVKEDGHADEVVMDIDLEDVAFLSETNSALIHELEIAHSIKAAEVQEGTLIISVTMGGSTVDVGLCKILSVSASSGIECEEVLPPIGAMLGGNSLNENLRKLVKKKLRSIAPYLFEVNLLTEDEPLDRCVKYFEDHIKPILSFDKPCRQAIEVPHLRKDAEKDIRKAGWLPISEMEKDVLELTYSEIAKMIRSQCDLSNRTPDWIVAFGGAVTQPYFRPYIESYSRKYIDQSRPLRLLNFQRPTGDDDFATAVAAGMVYAAIHPASIPHWKIQTSYGYKYSAPYEEGRRRKEKRIQDLDGSWIIPDLVH